MSSDLHFLHGKNLKDAGIAVSAGKVYLDTATNELWYDDPSGDIKDKHIRLFNNATKTADGLMSAEDKRKVNYTNVSYGTCNTAANVADKIVSFSTTENEWSLAVGAMITVLFTNTNTADNPTLNVNGTGAKAIYYNTTKITTSSLSYGGYANRLITYIYDGTYYRFVSWGTDANTKNTAGATNDETNKLFLVGAREQTSNPRTYTNDNAYISENHVFSNGSQVLNQSELVSTTNSTIASNTASTTSGRTYPVEYDKNGKLSVNVPWSNTNTWLANTATQAGYVAAPGANVSGKVWKTGSDGTPSWQDDANTTYAQATSSTLGLVKIGYSTNDQNYAVQLSSGKMYVNVPWTNTWLANTATQAGYVAAPGANVANKVWKTDSSGTPGWRDDADTNTDTWQANTVSQDGYVTAPTSSNANKVWKTDADGNPGWRTDSNTWVANSASQAGYVAAGSGNANKVWKTDASGVPGWRADADTNTKNTAGTYNKASTKLFIVGSTAQSSSSTGASATNTNSSVYIGTDNNLYDSRGLVASAASISSLSSAMIFRGTVGGTDATVETLPAASAQVEGDTYKVIAAGTYASQAAKVGDVFVCCLPAGATAYEWVLIPSGDEPSGTVTSIKTSDGITGGTITTSGTLKANLVSYTKNSAAATSSSSDKLYAVQLDKDGKLAIAMEAADKADMATYAKYIRITTTNPTSATTYNIPFVSGITSGTNYEPRGNNGFRYRTLEGTTTAEGYSRLYLGNSTSTGTAGNKSGGLLIYSSGASYQLLLAHPYKTNSSDAASSRTSYLRDYGDTGYLVATTTRDAVGSSTKPVYISASGVATVGSTYAGGTKVELNATDKGATTATFFAPLSAGTVNQILVSTGGAPQWSTLIPNAALPLRLRNYQSSGNADANDITESGFYYMSTTTAGGGNRPPFKNTTNDYRILATGYSNQWAQQIATNFRSNEIFFRRVESSGGSASWKDWVQILTSEGGTVNGLLTASGGIALDDTTESSDGLTYILGIKAFAEGGNVIWSAANKVSVKYATSAGLASKISDLSSSDKASSSATWRNLWFSYVDNATGRPAYDERFAIQTSTGTLKAPIFSGTLSGNASTATQVYVTETEPTSGTWYNPVWTASGSGNRDLRSNDGIRYYTLEGVAGTAGHGLLQLGNATAKATAGNKTGRLRIYGEGTKYSDIYFSGTSDNVTQYLPGYSGNVTISVTSASNPTSATTYNIPFYLNNGARIGQNDGLRYNTIQGTTSAVGWSGLYLGNSTASGTAGNKAGRILLYAQNANYTWVQARPDAAYSQSVFYLPAGDNASDACYAVWNPSAATAVGGSTTPVYVAANGKVVACAMSAASNRWGVLTSIGSDGVMEIGKYIDFHGKDNNTDANGDQIDYTYRLTADTSLLTSSGAFKAGSYIEASDHLKSGTYTTIGSYLTTGTYATIGTNLTVGGTSTLKGLVTLGNYTNDSTAPQSGIAVLDLRDITPTGGMFGDKRVNFYFDEINDIYNGASSASNRWASIMHIKGWQGDYASWELAGNAHSTSLQDTLRYRQGIGSTWGEWQSVLTDANFTTYLNGTYVNVTGDTMTGTLVINKTTPASGTADNGPALIVGGTRGTAHIEIDKNQVMAKATGTTTATLHLNTQGGLVQTGANLAIAGGKVTFQYNASTESLDFVFT